MRSVDPTRTGSPETGGPAPAAERWAVGSLALIALITAAWWALALWPVPGETPAWLARTRSVCFGATASGLPDASGWILLVGQPLGLVGLLLAGWRRPLASGLARTARRGPGRAGLALAAALLVGGLGAVGVRVARAGEAAGFELPADRLPPSTYPRIDRPAPDMALVDQEGRRIGASDFRGRPLLVTFAFGHCTTVCPAVVHQVLAARDALAADLDPAVLVVTLDPWRDTPARLPHLARQWSLPDRDVLVLSGEVEEVEAALDAWQVPRSRDRVTGDVVHPALVYLVEPDGTVAYASAGGVRALVALARRMEG